MEKSKSQNLVKTGIVVASLGLAIGGLYVWKTHNSKPYTDTSDSSTIFEEDEILMPAENLDILSDTSSLNLSMSSQQQLINEDDELIKH
jgi:hypothetical protein